MEKIQDKFGRFVGLESKSKPATKPSADDDRRARIREKAGRFRVLIIGRANAGKTTILRKVCNTVDQPEIFDSKGNKVETSVITPTAQRGIHNILNKLVFRRNPGTISRDSRGFEAGGTSEQPEIFDSNGNKIETSVITPTVQRGIHNIENELVFRSNPGFIFHDSRGFEAGGTSELDTVKRFIEDKSKERLLSSQLHVIWYCIPMDDERPFTAAELSFFSKCGTGSVPVVVIFTKFDALEDKAYGDLAKHFPHEDAVAQAPARAVADFENQHLPRVYGLTYPPKGHVYLRDMNKPETDCRELTQTVAAVLGDDDLQRLFVSTQRNNLGLCMAYAIKRTLTPTIMEADKPMPTMLTKNQIAMVSWYPNFYYWWDWEHVLVDVWDGRRQIHPNIMNNPEIQSTMSPFIGLPPAAQQMARSGVALAIIAEHSFYLWDRKPSNQAAYLITAIDTYKTSNKHTAVTQAVDEIFNENRECLFEEAKNSGNPEESAFAKRLVQIALDNCLSPPQST